MLITNNSQQIPLSTTAVAPNYYTLFITLFREVDYGLLPSPSLRGLGAYNDSQFGGTILGGAIQSGAKPFRWVWGRCGCIYPLDASLPPL